MRAVVIRAHGGNEQLLLETNYPPPKVGPGDVLVRVLATSINYHDVFTRRGMPGIAYHFPVIMGMDIAGEVVEVGPEVSGWKKGDRVLVDPSTRAEPGHIPDHAYGGLGEYYSARWHQLIALPDEISFEQAAALPVAYGTALRMVHTIGQVKAGESVLLLGASGGVGVCALQLAKIYGAEVIAAGSSDAKGEKLIELGADHFINYAREDFEAAVNKLYGRPGRKRPQAGVDVVINYTGGDTWVPSIRTLKHRGRLLTCGATAGFDPKEDIRHIWTFERQILGANGWAREDLLELLTLVRDGRLKVLIDRVLPLDQTAEAFRLLEDREVFGKVIVTP
ncbi:zinc-binding dehydrogenase [Bordetella sp. N]|uniref:zinc-binding dehydrogenase n=1 Tax=Bordetella sp. N TaxID=1746199 RepID=UPI000709064A|nr:zinc-binding dehydrogenase [Bordetella sp. N]ALM82275.1 zinc-binding dehydrogenase [Bordetella sp. N]